MFSDIPITGQMILVAIGSGTVVILVLGWIYGPQIRKKRERDGDFSGPNIDGMR